MDLLMPSTGLLFWMTLTFLIVLGLLWKFGFPVIVNMVNERKKYIDESLKKAQDANDRLANLQVEAESIMQEARGKQAEILKEATQTRDAIVEKAQEKARDEGTRLLNDARAEIASEKAQAMSDIRSQVAALSVQVAEKILKEKLSTQEAQMDFINRMLDDVEKK